MLGADRGIGSLERSRATLSRTDRLNLDAEEFNQGDVTVELDGHSYTESAATWSSGVISCITGSKHFPLDFADWRAGSSPGAGATADGPQFGVARGRPLA